MVGKSVHSSSAAAWALARRQHGVITRAQLLELGFGARSIEHRLGNGRLHPAGWGVYAVSWPDLTRRGEWMAAVLGCGPGAALSHNSAAAFLAIRPDRGGAIEISVPASRRPRSTEVIVHRRTEFEITHRDRIPVTTPTCTLIDLATRLTRDQLEAAVNQADKQDLITPDALRAAVEELRRRPGARALKKALDRRTFTLTDSALERRFLRIVRDAGLPKPKTQADLNGYRVDFYWPDLHLVVETDGLRYHRTPAEQARDRERDQAHTAAGLATLRFTHAQVRYEPDRVRMTLAASVSHMLSRSQSGVT
jgi:very-short-patch-repair endonuclease